MQEYLTVFIVMFAAILGVSLLIWIPSKFFEWLTSGGWRRSPAQAQWVSVPVQEVQEISFPTPQPEACLIAAGIHGNPATDGVRLQEQIMKTDGVIAVTRRKAGKFGDPKYSLRLELWREGRLVARTIAGPHPKLYEIKRQHPCDIWISWRGDVGRWNLMTGSYEEQDASYIHEAHWEDVGEQIADGLLTLPDGGDYPIDKIKKVVIRLNR